MYLGVLQDTRMSISPSIDRFLDQFFNDWLDRIWKIDFPRLKRSNKQFYAIFECKMP